MEKRYNTEIRELPVAAGLRLRSEEDGGEARTIEGMAIVFGRESQPLYSDEEMEIRERISPEAVTRELLDSSDILCTLYHDDRRILARSRDGAGTLRYDVTVEGVRFRFDAADTEDGRTALELVRRGEIDGCSFCYVINVADPESQTREVRTEGGRRIVTYTVNKIETIRDFTLTPRPAYRDLMGMALGCMGMSLRDFLSLYIEEFEACVRAWNEREDARERMAWERTRTAAAITAQPHCKKRLTPRMLIPLPWDNETRKARPLTQAEVKTQRERAHRLAAMMGEEG